MSDISGKTILIVDDDPHVSRLVELIFSREAARVVTASDGKEGLSQLRERRPDLVLLDLILPDMDGWQLCRAIREISDVPIIMVSGTVLDSNGSCNDECVADDFITKPYTIDLLLDRTGAALQRSTPTLND
jgi:DNA-binding response OmpR family regulator